MHSPFTPGIVRPGSASASDERELQATKIPASGPQRARSAGATGGKSDREKRKRSRVTPEQLVHLERFFAMDKSPTAARRKEISDLLGMQERQTQIWFQNRRAKAKLQDGKKGASATTEAPPDTPPELATGYEAELHSLLHEDEPVTIIPCSNLSIGTWRRIATTVGKHDLVAYVCDTKRCLTWFIHSSGYGFKMEIPFDIIVETEFTNAAPGSGLASFTLSQPPTFYLESFTSPPPDQGAQPIRQWKRCADWTEGQQATKILRHDLVGSAVQLAHVLRHLNAYTSGSDIRLHSPAYHVRDSPSTPMELRNPPMATLVGPNYHYLEEPPIDLQRSIVHGRGDSTSGFIAASSYTHQHGSHHSIEPPSVVVVSEPSCSSPHFQNSIQQQNIQSSHSPIYSEYPATVAPHNIPPLSHSPIDYGPSFPPHSCPRPYSSGSTHSTSYNEGGRIISPYLEVQQPVGIAHPSLATPSPPLLTTPFYPPGTVPDTRVLDQFDASIPIPSGMPAIMYDSDDSVQRRDL
ncbi:hypothetical protein F5I97DRAFT_1938024 [Phlebopus sp. FC_14]|nr:hypothetical protein F5I97DRAFT_1938024 [Phlebopus sp. FC_14]